MKRWFSLILAGCMLMQLTLGSSSGYMKAETESEGPAEVSDEVQEQNVEAQPEAAEEQEQPGTECFGGRNADAGSKR